MKTIRSSFVLGLMLYQTALASPGGAVGVPTLPEGVFAPAFNEGEVARVVLTGTFVNSCYQPGPVLTEFDLKRREIRLTQYAYFTSQGFCLEMLVPSVQTVDLGALPPGAYDLRVLGSAPANEHKEIRAQLEVRSVHDQTNDQYASVTRVSVLAPPRDGAVTLELSGELREVSGSCEYLSDIKIDARARNVIEVAPIVTLKEMGPKGSVECPKNFVQNVHLESPWRGNTLIYVRSKDGKSISRVVDF